MAAILDDRPARNYPYENMSSIRVGQEPDIYRIWVGLCKFGLDMSMTLTFSRLQPDFMSRTFENSVGLFQPRIALAWLFRQRVGQIEKVLQEQDKFLHQSDFWWLCMRIPSYTSDPQCHAELIII